MEKELYMNELNRLLEEIGMQHGLSYDDLKPVINPDGYSAERWGARRSQLTSIIKEYEKGMNAAQRANPPHKSPLNGKGKTPFSQN